MKLKNKKTGEIVEATDFNIISEYNSLAELNADWEDYEEPNYWVVDYITCGVDNVIIDTKEPEMDDFNKQIGNYFETREEAEKAVEKLKALKRLKDKGFKFVGWEDTNNDVDDILFELPYMEWDKNVCDDLDSLFGGER